MARLPRFAISGQPQHIILRGNNRTELFLEEADFHFFLEKLQAACEKHGCDLHAYVLMSNHVHLLITPHSANGISKMMQMLGRYYVQYFNAHYQRSGTLFEGRYKATLIDSETYLLTCMRYIELNPVRAGLVRHPSDYLWSSYQRTAGGQASNLIKAHVAYQRLGRSNDERLSAYRQLFKQQLSEHSMNEIRDATNKAWALGSERFKQKIQKQLERRIAPIARGGDRKSERFKNEKL